LFLIAFTFLSSASAWAQPTAPAAPPDDSGVALVSLGPGVWLHRSFHTFSNGVRFGANGLLVEDEDGLTLIDTAWGADKTRTLLQQITQTIGLPVRRALVTHAHDDRVAGVDVLKAMGIPVFAHPETVKRAAAAGLPVPDAPLALSLAPMGTTRLGSLEITFPGAGHAPDNIVVWLRDRQLLFGGCLVRALADRAIPDVPDVSPASWPETAARLVARYGDEARLVVPGHGRIGGAALLTHTRRLADALATEKADEAAGTAAPAAD
jgi:metallo-beta-lactamase class B VIM